MRSGLRLEERISAAAQYAHEQNAPFHVGLMVALLAVGLTSITWMVIVSLIVFLQKAVPLHPRIDTAIALLLVAAGAWVALWPSSVQMLMAVP